MIAVQQTVIDRVADYYRRRPVLVTGGMSFIGSHLVEALVATGAEVTVADDLSSGGEGNVASVRDRITFHRGDLRDRDFATFVGEGQQVVFHLAAAHGGRGFIDTHPVDCVSNLGLDYNVFSAAAKAGAEKVVHASSACTYPLGLQEDPGEQHLLREDEAGFDQPGMAFADGEYGWAKLMGEFQLHAFYRQHGLQAVACRLFSAYGERENESHAVIALIAKALARRDPFPIWGDGEQDRNFIYVGDIAAGMLLSGALISGFETVNIGNSAHMTINELVQEIFSIVGWTPNEIRHEYDMPVGVRSRAADPTKLQSLVGWTPAVPPQEGLKRTVEWYRSVADAERLQSIDAILMAR